MERKQTIANTVLLETLQITAHESAEGRTIVCDIHE